MPIYIHIQNATFQLLLASDGLTTYTGFLYKAMHFLPPKKAVMGYRCGKSARSIFNLPGSLTSSIYSEVINNGDNGIILLPPSLFINNIYICHCKKRWWFSSIVACLLYNRFPRQFWNHFMNIYSWLFTSIYSSETLTYQPFLSAKNTKGLWIYKLDTCSNSDINYVERCHNWRVTSGRGEREMTSLAHNLLASCPCNVRQMQADPRFLASTEEPGCYFKIHSPRDYSFTRVRCSLPPASMQWMHVLHVVVNHYYTFRKLYNANHSKFRRFI